MWLCAPTSPQRSLAEAHAAHDLKKTAGRQTCRILLSVFACVAGLNHPAEAPAPRACPKAKERPGSWGWLWTMRQSQQVLQIGRNALCTGPSISESNQQYRFMFASFASRSCLAAAQCGPEDCPTPNPVLHCRLQDTWCTAPARLGSSEYASS